MAGFQISTSHSGQFAHIHMEPIIGQMSIHKSSTSTGYFSNSSGSYTTNYKYFMFYWFWSSSAPSYRLDGDGLSWEYVIIVRG